MSRASFLVRFDDICPTMNWQSWEKIEKVLIAEKIRPLLAVVPDNRDQKLKVGPEDRSFWLKVKKWQDMGWSIAVHGYQHQYRTENSGLMGLNPYSEFAGLSYEIQHEYLRRALEVFKANHVHPDLWIAPAHSFDETTVKILRDLGIKVLSDGFYTRPIKRFGLYWIPQQLWRFKNFRFGLWTVCFHLNTCTDDDLKDIAKDLEKFTSKMTSLDAVLKRNPITNYGLWDFVFSIFWKTLLFLKKTI